MTDVPVPAWRVVVASDEALVAETVRAALTTRGFVAAVVTLDPLGEQATAAAESASAGLLISALTSYPSITAARRLVVGSDVPWVVVTGVPPGPAWGALLDAGAEAVMGSAVAIDELAVVLGSLARGTRVGDHDLEARLRREWQDFERERAAVTARLAVLTPSEMAILRALYLGRSSSEIAADRRSSEPSVHTQIRALLAKLDLGDQLAAVVRLGELLALDPGADPLH